ncbi:hypothetical protein GCM10009759_60470 [Kitasatospora saccharophila]|uniref:Uncharacterized protein n=1 Tax=Kitasatospora saccharophila TaxID=407973 RepID=A0ABN2XNP5_9ACTN
MILSSPRAPPAPGHPPADGPSTAQPTVAAGTDSAAGGRDGHHDRAPRDGRWHVMVGQQCANRAVRGG